MREFLATERCDRCGAQAHHAANKAGHPELLFCSHHIRQHKITLLETYWLIESDQDMTAAAKVAVPTE